MSNLIFGHSWDDIQAMQQGKYKAPTVQGQPTKPQATSDDLALLEKHGRQGLIELGFFGIIDRLDNTERG